jgi:aspartate aminotransferase
MVAPASGFYSSPGMGLNQIRIAYVLKQSDLLKSVNIIEQGLKAYKNA